MHRLAYPLLVILTILPVVAIGVAFAIAPDTVPMHIGLSGEVTRYGDKSELLLLGGIFLVCNVVIAACYVFADKLNAVGLLSAPGAGAQKVRIARIILLVTEAFCDVLVIGVVFYLLSLA